MHPMRVGSARVWRRDQRLDPQRDALLADLCEWVFEGGPRLHGDDVE
jgi:hypothetical protein